ncbi:MAG: hypothetical protein JJ848_000160 [Prochlorococcus marinus CUG1439]|uniref:hypothetical protein n=1 Tax=Prochlorococcus sp. MIT 1314 TaxID=3096220 RepID=UPI001B13B239|nr:hypothetical protein [Prochlorococcus sp. MIT 1314]MCR8538755.1 hypothetical protein [Prochlorococcus marinus CUG1439]
MDKYLSRQEVEDYWDILIKKDIDLFIYSLSTNNLATNWAFIFRHKILKLLIPKEVKIGTLELNKKYCELESLRSKSKSNSDYLSFHSVMIRDLIRNLNPNSYCLIIDIDAFPLSTYSIKLTFVLAMLKGINGNIQRTNCINNEGHLFIGPSYICFNTEAIIKLKEAAWIANTRSDVSEEITWAKPELIDHHLFKPISTIFKPIWALEGEKKIYGIGTTFGYNYLPINYHHFYSRNFIARMHFFLISFSKYLKIKLTHKDDKKNNLKLKIKQILIESKFSIKYILGRIL